jgi:hypothetical protein
MMGAVYRHGGMEKFDCFKNDMAWSAKTSEQLSAGAVYFKLLTLAREDLARKGSIADLAPNELGRRALRLYNAEVIAKTYGRFKHFRSLVLYQTHDLDTYTLYEKDLLPVDPRRYRWKKHFRKGKYVSIHAFDRATGEHRFSVTLGDCRLFLADPIPADAHVFSVRLDTGEIGKVKTEFRAICDRRPDCVSISKMHKRG